MKVRASVKPICEKCKVIKRHGKVMVICEILSISRDKASKIGYNIMTCCFAGNSVQLY